MAPRSTKTKKATDVKLIEKEEKSSPSKGKAAINEQPEIKEKKAKRGKKVEESNGQEEVSETVVTVPKGKGRKQKAIDEKVSKTNGVAEKENGDDVEKNGHSDEEVKVKKGKKVETKKETSVKPTKGRGRKIAVSKVDEEENEAEVEEIKKESTKGKRKGTKATKQKSEDIEIPEVIEDDKMEEEETTDKQDVEDSDEEVEEEPPAKKRKGAKKGEKTKGSTKAKVMEDVTEKKPSKGRKGPAKKQVQEIEAAEELQQDEEPVTKRSRKGGKAENSSAKAKVPPKNKTGTNYEDIELSNCTKSSQGKEWNLKISNWNVDGIRAWMTKGGLDYLKYEKPDILCLQETKCAKDKLPDEVANLPGYHAYWLGSEKDGYAGVGLYTTKLAINVQYGLQNEELDNEGRIITAEYEQFYLICTYVPNAGRKLVTLPRRLKWNEEFRKYVKELDKKKPVVICGDMNVAHNEIDLANPKTNKRNAGFTEEERSGMTDLLDDGFIDTFRHLNPDKTDAYTFWTYMSNARAKNVGWRLDYFIISERLLPSLCDSVIRNEVYGSDHCPITLFLHLTSADKPKE